MSVPSMRGEKHNLEIPIGVVVKTWREHRGLSVTDLAERAGLKKGHLSQIETGKIGTPNRATLQKLADALGVEDWTLHVRRMPEAESAGDEPEAVPSRPFLITGPGSLGLSQPALAWDAQFGTVGHEIEALIAAAELTEAEQRLFGQKLLSVAKELLSLLIETRKL